MKKTSIVIIVGCLFILVNISIAASTANAASRTIGRELKGTPFPSFQGNTLENLHLHQTTLLPSNAGKPYSGQSGVPIQFDGSQSSILPGTGVSYVWDFGDGTTGYGVNPTHIYQENTAEGSKVYIATLKIKKSTEDEYWDMAPVYIDLPDQDHLVPYGGCSYSADVGESILFDGSQSVNTNGGSLRYRWDFGDGSGFTSWSYDETATHAYNNINVYKVKLQVKDNSGNIRQDLLHADIGCTYSSAESFFIGSNVIFDDVLDLLFDRNSVGFTLLCTVLDAKIYVNYNDDFIHTYSLGVNGYTLPLDVDVNYDGTDDVVIGDLAFFDIGNEETSPFDNTIASMPFKTTLSDITLNSNTITEDDSITVCLQFSFGPIVQYLLDLNEPIIRVGFQSEAGQDKPSQLSVTHLYKPYLYEKIINEKGAAVKPEHGVQINGANDDSFSLIGMVSNADETDTTTLKVTYESFMPSKIVHRSRLVNSELMRDFKFEGGDDSSVTISLTREKYSEISTLGMSIYPIESFTSHVVVKPTQEGGGEIIFNIDNPLENLVLFAEKETEEEEKSVNFYLKNLPNTIEFEWLPKLDGYIQLQSSGDGLEIGICDDIKDPKSKLYFTKDLQSTTRLEWLIDDDSDDKSISLSAGTAGLTLNGYFKDLTEENQLIEFNATTQENLELTLEWNAVEKWFKLQRNDKAIDFNFLLEQELLMMDISGSLVHTGDGVTFTFGDLENGGITFGGDTSLDLDINIEKTDDYTLSTGLLFENNGDIDLQWGGSSHIGFQSTTSVGLYDFSLDKQDYNLTMDEITLSGAGNIDLTIDGDNKGIALQGSLGLDLKDIAFDLKTSGQFIAILGEFSTEVGSNIHLYNDDESIKHLEVDGVLSIDFNDCNFKFNDNVISIAGTFTIGNEVNTGNPDTVLPGDRGEDLDTETPLDSGFELQWRLPDILKISTGSDITLDIVSFNFEPPTGWNIEKVSADNIAIGVGGGIDFDIAGDQFTLITGSSLDVDTFYFEKINSDFIQIGTFSVAHGGSIVIDWSDTQGVELSSNVMFSVSDLEINNNIVVFKIIGSIDIEADSYVYLSQGTLDAGFTGVLDVDCTFELNSNQVTIDGVFTLSTGSGVVGIEWASNEFTVDVSDGPSLSISDLTFEVGALSISADLIEIGSSGSVFNAIWDTATNDITISSGSGTYLILENIGFAYDALNLGIDGVIDLYTNGFVHIAPGTLEAGITGSINLGEEGCEIQLNGETVTIGGLFTVSGQHGVVDFTWTSEEFSLSLPSEHTLAVSNLYFEKGPLVISTHSINVGTSGAVSIFINKDIKTFDIDGSKSFGLSGFSIAINGETLGSFDSFNIVGGGYLHLSDGSESKINLGFNGQIGINSLDITPPVNWGWNLGTLEIDSLSLTGEAVVNIGNGAESVFDILGTQTTGTMTGLYMYVPLDDNEVFELDLGEVSVSGNFSIGMSDKLTKGFEISNTGSVILSSFAGEFRKWSGSFDQISTNDNSVLEIIPDTKYCKYQTGGSSLIQNLDIAYTNSETPAKNIDFELVSLDTGSIGAIEFDLGATAPKVTLSGSADVELDTLHVAIGNEFDFAIPEVTLNGDASVYAELTNSYVELGFDVDLSELDIEIETLNFGNWDISGTLEGSAIMRLNEWQPGVSGELQVTITEQISHNLQITYNDIVTVDFGTQDLTPGTVTFDWRREQEGPAPGILDGYLNILNSGVNGNFTLCKITNNDPLNPIEIELGSIALESGNLYTSWSKQYEQKTFYVNSGVSTNIGLIKVTWEDEKTISLGNIELEPGEFKFAWNTTGQEVKVNNGIAGFGPLCSYEDSERKLSADLLNIQHDYSKTMTLRWYKDDDDEISGIYVDTDEVNFVDWITFEVVKYDTSGNTGRRIAFGGLQADEFEIKKNVDGKLQISGKLYIANHLTFSKLINGNWKNLDMQWDLNLDGIGYIEFETDVGFNEDMEISATLLDVDITSTFDLPHHLKFSWDVDFDGQGSVTIDTDMQEIYEITFEMTRDTQQHQPKWGIYIGAVGLIAEDYNLYWDFTDPPWVIGSNGYIEPGCINDIYIAWNGNWYDLWWGSGQPTSH